jgi:hypothetical protein
MIDGDTIKIIAGIVATAYPAIAKYWERKARQKQKEKEADPDLNFERALKRLKEIDEIVEIPDHVEMPEALVDLIEERNHYLLESRHYRRLYNERHLKDGEEPPDVRGEGI